MTRIRRHEETLAEQNCTPDSLTTLQKQIAGFCLRDRLPANSSMTQTILGGGYLPGIGETTDRTNDSLARADTLKPQQDSSAQLKTMRFLVQSKRGN
jgi:hypothetical protein